jgi:hypothetical protein
MRPSDSNQVCPAIRTEKTLERSYRKSFKMNLAVCLDSLLLFFAVQDSTMLLMHSQWAFGMF